MLKNNVRDASPSPAQGEFQLSRFGVLWDRSYEQLTMWMPDSLGPTINFNMLVAIRPGSR